MTKLILINTCPKCRCTRTPIKGETIKTDKGTENFCIVFRCMDPSCGYTSEETYENIDQNFKKILTNSSPIELIKNISEDNETKKIQFELSKETVFGTSDENEIIEKLIDSGLLKIEFNTDGRETPTTIYAGEISEKYNEQLRKIITTLRDLQDRISSNNLIVEETINGKNVLTPI